MSSKSNVSLQSASFRSSRTACFGQLLVALLLVGPAAAAPRIPLPLFGLSVVLPDGWTADIPPAKPIPVADKDNDFQTQVKAVCKTEACDRSREVCTIRVYDEVMQTWDVISNELLFPRQADMDKTTSTVLDWTSVGASVHRPLGKETIGQRPGTRSRPIRRPATRPSSTPER